MRSRLWLLPLAAGAVAAPAYVATTSLVLKTVIVFGLPAAAVACILAGFRLHRPTYRRPWLLLAFVQAAWAIGWIFWQASILRTDAAPAVDSPENIFFFAIQPFFVVALALVLRRVDKDAVAFVDTAIVALALLTVAWPTLMYRYLTNDAISA